MDTPERDSRNPDLNGGTIPNAEPAPEEPQHDEPELVHTSRLAVVACILGVMTLLLVPGLMLMAATGGGTPFARELYLLSMEALALGAVLLGLMSVVRIELSAGRLAGRGFAWTGVAVPMTQWLLVVLLASLAQTGNKAFPMTCGTNLSNIGKAMLVYANDYEDELPRAGGRNSTWGPVNDWLAPNRYKAYNVNPTTGEGGAATISSCLYLLIKYGAMTPKLFICKGDIGATEFKPADLPAGIVGPNFELIDAWDFGPPAESMKHCSYSYHVPFGLYALTTSSGPGFPVAADRNPWIDAPSTRARDFAGFRPDLPPFGGTKKHACRGNTFTHQDEGQNVLFLDSHVAFEKRSFCGVDDDNIYTVSARPPEADPWGTPPSLDSRPACRKDSLLVHDPPQLAERSGTGPLPAGEPAARHK